MTAAQVCDSAYGNFCDSVPQSGSSDRKKARSPIVERRVRRTTSDDVDAERRRWRVLTSDDWWNSSASYHGAIRWRHLREVDLNITIHTVAASRKEANIRALPTCIFSRPSRGITRCVQCKCPLLPYHSGRTLVIFIPKTLGHCTAFQFGLNTREVCFCRWKTGPLVIPTFDVSFLFLALGIFTNEDDKNNFKIK